MNEQSQQRGGDLVLPPGEYAFVLDTTKGQVNTIVGPQKVSLSNTDNPVIWENGRFVPVSIDRARQQYVNAVEGSYVVLQNPGPDGDHSHPRDGSNAGMSPKLLHGRSVNIPGPAYFPLWPGQSSKIVPGHVLRSNQYLLVTVTNEEEARANWDKAIMKRAQTLDLGSQEGSDDQPKPQDDKEGSISGSIDINSLALGAVFTIKGDQVSFYIPPTGIEVQVDEHQRYIRDALTLERLEYCILLDENGNKSYVRGPAVVFPLPSQTFVIAKDGSSRKFKAIELNQNSGLYIKVIADYEEEGVKYLAGQELFITGEKQAIYYPRPEHSIITYGDQNVHHAIAIPSGEGRYVLNRVTGNVETITGPRMLLPDPRTHVVVRRILSQGQVNLMYPGNMEAQGINRQLEAESTGSGQYMASLRDDSLQLSSATKSARRSVAADSEFGDGFSRGTSYTKPRTITLNTKYDGAVSVDIWTGFAVLVTNKKGDRRVVVGPQTVQLEYDENLQVMELSTGKPKTTDNLLKTVYLQVANNRSSDLVRVETRDMVPVEMKLSVRASFVGKNSESWFAVDNYVKFMTDHIRSILKAKATHYDITEFYTHATKIVRDTILGVKEDESQTRPGLLFPENNLHVTDVEILAVTIIDRDVAALLSNDQRNRLVEDLTLQGAKRKLAVTVESERIERATVQERLETFKVTAIANEERANRKHSETVKLTEYDLEVAEMKADAKLSADVAEAESKLTLAKLEESVAEVNRSIMEKDLDLKVSLTTKTNDESIRLAEAEAKFFKEKATALTPQAVAAMQSFADCSLVKDLSTNMAPLAILGGTSVSEVMAKLLGGTGLVGAISNLANLGASDKS